MINPGPSYFLKFQIGENGFRLTLNQSHHNASYPITIEKLGDSIKVLFKPNETLINGALINDSNANSQKSVQYKFDKTPNSKLVDSIQMVNQYKFDQWSTCELKSSNTNLFTKGKVNGVKLGKDGSTYFLKNNNPNKLNSAWYDSVYSFFRPCNREMSSKLTKSVIKSSKLISSSSLTTSSGSTSAPKSAGSGSTANDDDDLDDFDDDADSTANSINYTALDGLFSRHPIDDSPNDFKFGWLTIYDKDDMFRKPGNWQLVLSMSIIAAVESNFEKFASM